MMRLTTRLTVIVLVFSGLVAGGLMIAGAERARLVARQVDAAIARDRATLWSKLIETQHQRMEAKWSMLSSDLGLMDALSRGWPARARRLMPGLVETIRAAGVARHVELYDAEGAMLFTSLAGVEPTSVASPETVRRTLETGEVRRGIGNDTQRHILVAVIAPLRYEGRVVGAATFGLPIDDALAELGASTGTTAMLVNRRNRHLAGAGSAMWQRLDRAAPIDLSVERQAVRADGASYVITRVPVTANLANLVAYVVTIRDATLALREQDRIDRISLAIAAIMLIASMVGLSWYLRRSLAPLDASVTALQALSRGETRVPILGTDRRDEIGRIAQAVYRYRRDLVAYTHMRRSRERQRLRLESFIRREMTALANTLDAAARDDILRDLTEIERTNRNGAELAGDAVPEVAGGRPGGGAVVGADGAALGDDAPQGLTLMATAFEKLGERIRDQQHRMTGLIADLREALETRTAYLALQRELETARRVQIGSLPAPWPPADDLELDGCMLTANEVGGDFYDFFPLPRDRVGLVIADVSGKGIPAALYMSICRTLMRAVAPRYDRPGACLAALNDLLANDNRESFFITAIYAILDRESGRLKFANAGHHPPVLIRADAAAAQLPQTDGAALALLQDVGYEDASIALGPGDALFLYTDGITEAFNAAHQQYGEDRLLRCLTETGAETPRTVLNQVVTDVRAFSGDAARSDDLTCLCLRYTGRGPQSLADAPP